MPVPQAPIAGSFLAQQRLAKEERQEALAKALAEPDPVLAATSISVAHALCWAVRIVKQTRSKDPASAIEFISAFVRLETFLAWLTEAGDMAATLKIWPSDPGCIFGLKAGASALD